MTPAIGVGISPVFSTSKTSGASGAFSPASLFSGGEVGAWYDPSDLSTMFQDAAGTTPVTSDSDPVGRIEDKSGNGNHLTQGASTARRPLYRTDGTLHWLEFDGVDDWLTNGSATFNATEDAMSMFVSIFSTASTGDHRILCLGEAFSQPDSYLILEAHDGDDITDRSAAVLTGNPAVAIRSTVAGAPLEKKVLGAGVASATDLFVRDNGETTSVGTRRTLSNTVLLYLGGIAGLPGSPPLTPYAGAFYGGVVINRILSGSEVTDLESYLNDAAGI